jgi:hypothetical protein
MYLSKKFLVLIIILVAATFVLSSLIPGNKTDTNTNVVGNDRDAHGCIPSAGYTWCAEKSKCLRLWEEKCTEESNNANITVDINQYKKDCPNGYWCDIKKKCVSMEETCLVA